MEVPLSNRYPPLRATLCLGLSVLYRPFRVLTPLGDTNPENDSNGILATTPRQK
jgi:hypothetical protein